MNEIDLIVHEIILITDFKGAERKEYLKMLVSILMHGGRLEDIKNIKLNKVKGASCCF